MDPPNNQTRLAFPGLNQRLDGVFGSLGESSAPSWSIASTITINPGHGPTRESTVDDDEDGDEEEVQGIDERKDTGREHLCSTSGFVVDEIDVYGPVEATARQICDMVGRSTKTTRRKSQEAALPGSEQVPALHPDEDVRVHEIDSDQDSRRVCIEFSQSGSCRFDSKCKYVHIAFDPSKYTKYDIDWDEEEPSNAASASQVFEALRRRKNSTSNETPNETTPNDAAPVFVPRNKRHTQEAKKVTPPANQGCISFEDVQQPELQEQDASKATMTNMSLSKVTTKRTNRKYRKKNEAMK